MIKYTIEDKTLVIPRGLGPNAGSGSGGSGMTPQEVQDMIDTSIDEYDTEIQVDIEDLSDRISGNTEDIAELSGATVALKEQVDGLSLSGITADIEALSGQTSANTQNIGVLSGAVETLSASLSGYTTTDTFNSGISGVQWQISGLSEDVTALSAFTSGLSFTVREQSQNLEQLSGATVAVEQAVSGKQDTLSAGNGIEISGATISVKAGEGLGFSGGTLVVSGSTGGGIPKVSDFPDNPEDGDVVFLEGYELSGYTVVKENVDNWEVGYAMCHIDGWYDAVSSDGYGTNYGRYFDNNGIKMRYRKDETNLYLDLIGDISGIDIQDCDSDSYAENSFPFLGRYFKYSEAVGMWLPLDYKVYVDYEKDYDTLKGLWLEIYEGLSDFSSNNLVILNKNNRSQIREFEPYESKYYGMDVQACDGRGAQDGNFGRISVETYRCSYDYGNEILNWGALVGEAFTTTESDVRTIVNQTISISYARFGNDGRGYLTYDADNDRFEYDSAYVATGDTSNACPDLVDWLITKEGLIDGVLIFNYLCVQNLNKLFVVSGGTTHTYTHPAIGFVELASPYTIGDYTFGYEITYKYADWELKIDMSENNNVGANVRISAV